MYVLNISSIFQQHGFGIVAPSHIRLAGQGQWNAMAITHYDKVVWSRTVVCIAGLDRIAILFPSRMGANLNSSTISLRDCWTGIDCSSISYTHPVDRSVTVECIGWSELNSNSIS